MYKYSGYGVSEKLLKDVANIDNRNTVVKLNGDLITVFVNSLDKHGVWLCVFST